MTEKAKKVYEAPFMKVYEIGRTQILAGSDTTTTLEDFESDTEVDW